jgi:hypothetical protein
VLATGIVLMDVSGYRERVIIGGRPRRRRSG